MSILGVAAILANVHGAGAYIELDLGSSWSDRLGLMSRGEQILLEGGYFTGSYRGSYGFGTFWQFGGGLSSEPIYAFGLRDSPGLPRRNQLLESFYFPHVCFGRGANLFRLGLWWKVRVGPIWSVDRENVFYARDASWGGAVSGEIAAVYNTGSVFSLGPKIGFGYMLDADRGAYSINLGLVLHFQVPMTRVKTPPEQRSDYWEKDY